MINKTPWVVTLEMTDKAGTPQPSLVVEVMAYDRFHAMETARDAALDKLHALQGTLWVSSTQPKKVATAPL